MSDLIDRQAAIDYFFRPYSNEETYSNIEIERVLKQLPSVQPEKRTDKRTETHACDCVERQAAIDAVSNWLYDRDDGRSVDQLLSTLPSVQPQRQTGKWIYDGYDHPHGIEWCHCSICGNRDSVGSVYTQVDIYPYCAKCGAKMEVEHESDRR